MSAKGKIQNNLGFVLFVGTLIGLSAFFTVRVEAFRARGAKSKLVERIDPGTEVTLVDVLDGDELVVTAPSGANFRVRILGIKAFDPTATEPGISIFGKFAVVYLTKFKGERLRLEFQEFKKDSRGRLLSYVMVGKEDLGGTLVARGLALAYVKYPVAREEQYRRAMVKAEQERKGLWYNQRAIDRARALIASWEADRDD